MSFSEIYAFDKNGDILYKYEMKNALRRCLDIWGFLQGKYLPPTNLPLDKTLEDVWCLFFDNKVSEIDKTALAITFDRAVVRKEEIPRLLEALDAFEYKVVIEMQIEIIKYMHEDNKIMAIGWNQTDIGEENWRSKAAPHNILKHKNHWYLFDRLN